MKTREKLKAKYPALHTLEAGTRYIASRPIFERGRKVYHICIRYHDDWDAIAMTIYDLDYDTAGEFLDAFNNGKSSFDGRVW